MAKRKTIKDLFKGRHFEQKIIILCVRWYLRYKLSSRDLVEMMIERCQTPCKNFQFRAGNSVQ
ncbi:MAG: integrase core domain protein [Herminiimonas sp.]|nr:integrase core domain protein [Herminiimonas sp.]